MTAIESDFSMYDDESDFDSEASFMSDDENVAPPSKKGSKPAQLTEAVLSPNKNAGNVTAKGKGKKTIEEIYQKKSQLEHILLRPDTYIGSVERLTQNMWILDKDTEKIVNREITFTPGLFKIFDESKSCVATECFESFQNDSSLTQIPCFCFCFYFYYFKLS